MSQPAAGSRAGRPARALVVGFDHAGDLDRLLATPAGSRAYRNNLAGTFREMAARMGLSGGGGGGGGGSRDVAFGDFDGDGHTDLVIVGDDGRLRLFRNLSQGRFEDATAASGLGGVSGAGTVAVGDYDNDGFLDLFVTSLDGAGGGGPALYHNRGDGTFEPDARAGELRRKLRGVAGLDAAFFDFDNAGFLDLVVVGKPPASPAGGRGVFLFRNDPTRGFQDYSSILPDSLRAGRAVAVADVDQDGDLDLIVVGWDGRPRLLRNDGGNVNQYVKVRLVGLREGSGKNNTFGLGATLELRAGDLYQLRLATDRAPRPAAPPPPPRRRPARRCRGARLGRGVAAPGRPRRARRRAALRRRPARHDRGPPHPPRARQRTLGRCDVNPLAGELGEQ